MTRSVIHPGRLMQYIKKKFLSLSLIIGLCLPAHIKANGCTNSSTIADIILCGLIMCFGAYRIKAAVDKETQKEKMHPHDERAKRSHKRR